MKRQTYYLQRERRGCIITLLVGDVCLHLRWRAHLPGDRYEFEGISITYVNLAILTETDLLRRIADLPLDMTPMECQSLVEQWGFTRARV